MKRNSWAAALLALAVGFPACSSDPDPDPTPNPDPEPEETACAERSDSGCEATSDEGPTCQLVTLQAVGEDDNDLACLSGETETVCVDVAGDNCDTSSNVETAWEDDDGAVWITDGECGSPDHIKVDFGDVEDSCEDPEPCVPASGGMGGGGGDGGAGGCSGE